MEFKVSVAQVLQQTLMRPDSLVQPQSPKVPAGHMHLSFEKQVHKGFLLSCGQKNINRYSMIANAARKRHSHGCAVMLLSFLKNEVEFPK